MTSKKRIEAIFMPRLRRPLCGPQVESATIPGDHHAVPH